MKMAVFVAMYVVGLAASTFLRAWDDVHDDDNAIATYREYFRKKWVKIGVRMLLCTGFFIWWWNDPALVSRVFDLVGAQFSDPLKGIIQGFELPLNVGTAGIYGVCCDSVLDKLVSYARSKLPR